MSTISYNEKDLDRIDYESLLVANDVFSYGSPKDRLINILKEDKDINQNFYEWMDISMTYQKQTSDRMFENIPKIDIENEDGSD
jgi:hypothetical protein